MVLAYGGIYKGLWKKDHCVLQRVALQLQWWWWGLEKGREMRRERLGRFNPDRR